EDIPDLARYFLRRAEDEGLPKKSISQKALEALNGQSWAGNVRELENLMKRLAALCADDVIDAETVETELAARPSSAAEPAPVMGESLGAAVEHHLKRYFDLHGGATPPPGLYDRILKEVELPLIALTLDSTRGNQLKAAEVLGINRNTLRKKIRELDIPVTRGKKLM
ncbi:MAG: helix-turn-helix domain-containing protein, partial [Pseudomonadota bacterium]